MKYKRSRELISESLLQLYPNKCAVNRLEKQLIEKKEKHKVTIIKDRDEFVLSGIRIIAKEGMLNNELWVMNDDKFLFKIKI